MPTEYNYSPYSSRSRSREEHLRRNKEKLRREEYLRKQYGSRDQLNNYSQPSYVRGRDGRIYQILDKDNNELLHGEIEKENIGKAVKSPRDININSEHERREGSSKQFNAPPKYSSKSRNIASPAYKDIKSSKSKAGTSYRRRKTKPDKECIDGLAVVEDASDNEDEFAFQKSLRPSSGQWMEPV